MKQIPLLIIVFISLITDSYAQQDTGSGKKKQQMHVDMPDETEETDLVDPGQVQLETATLYNRYRTGNNSVIGQALLRYGLSERVEVRVLIEDGRQRDRYIEETVQSTYPLTIGTKVSLLKDYLSLPDITFVSYVKLPFTGRSKSQNAYWSPIFLLAFQHQWLDDKLKLEYNIGPQQEAYSTDWVYSANASLHYMLTQSLEAFVEYYAQFSTQQPIHNIGGGLAWQAGKNAELYLSTGSTVNYSKYSHFIAGGIAVRTPG